MSTEFTIQIGTALVLLANTVAVVWWASKLTANQLDLKESFAELKVTLKEHINDDREFQMDVVRHLSGVKPTNRQNGSH